MAKAKKNLSLIRHGKSDWGDSTLPDRERPLNPRGNKDIPCMAEALNDAGLRPSLIIASSAKRTWQTAQLLADGFGYPREFMHREDSLYLAGLKTLLATVAEQDNSFNSIILCGHNPGITECANYLIPGLTANMPTGSAVTVSAEAETWAELISSPVTLVSFLTPKTLDT